MALADAEQRTHVGFRGPMSQQTKDPSLYLNQLQFNVSTPYSINSLASNVQKPQPFVVEKVPRITERSTVVDVPAIPHRVSVPSSPASSISSERLHFAVQLAKMDARKLKEQREMEHYYEQNLRDVKLSAGQNERMTKPTQVHGVRKMQTARKQKNYVDKMPQEKLQNKNRKDKDVKRKLQEYHFYPDSEHYPDMVNTASDDKQTREVRRLEKQMHKYLERLDELIHKGQEVIQKKDKRLRRNHRDDVSHLSDEDPDPRQFDRAEEQATRSARVLYMIERQIRELDDELRRKGKNISQPKKNQTLGRLAAAQRATVRALQMLINSAPMQPKGAVHYHSIYQELTSLIQQLSLLSVQLENGTGSLLSPDKRSQKPYQLPKTGHVKEETRVRSDKEVGTSNRKPAFAKERSTCLHGHPPGSSVNALFPDDSGLTIEATPERSATLKAGLDALLQAKALEQKIANPVSVPVNIKKKSVLLPPSLKTKRRMTHLAAQRTVKFPNQTAHFTRETTASRLKKVEKQKSSLKDGMKENEKADEAHAVSLKSTMPSGTVHGTTERLHENLHEKEIQRQIWLEDESRRKLREVLEIPKHLVSEAEEAIKLKLKPLLDEAQAVVESSKAKTIQKRFADLASNVTMKESEALSEMILDDLLTDTAEEFQRLEDDGDAETQTEYLQNSSTLENILQRLEQFEKDEESIRRRLNHVVYTDPGENISRPSVRQNERRKPSESGNTCVEEERREPCPIVIEPTSAMADKGPLVEDKDKVDKRQLLRFTKDRIGNSSTENYDGRTSETRSKRLNYTKTSSLARRVELHPVSVFLPSKVRENIFSYREKYSRYLKQTNTEHHGTFDPWKVVERLSDEILDGILEDVAVEFGGACDDVMELIFKSEFLKE